MAALGSGEVFFAPLPIRLWPGKFRDPDIVYLKPGRISDPHHQPQGADLVVEVVSEDDEDRRRDLETKRQEYAEAGIAEYWIVDPKERKITVLKLEGSAYRLHGEFGHGATVSSALLPHLSAPAVDAVLPPPRPEGGPKGAVGSALLEPRLQAVLPGPPATAETAALRLTFPVQHRNRPLATNH